MTDVWIKSNKKYILYTIICLAYLSNGLDLALVGPSVKDLAALMKTDEENVLFGFTIRSFANGISSLIACYSISKFSRQFQYTLSILVYGVATILLPYLTNINQYLFLSACFGFSNAYIDISTNLFVFELFQNHHLNFHVQCVYFSLSIGQAFGPLMLGPFLAASNQKSDLNETFLNYYNQSTNQTVLTDEIAQTTAIFVPFIIGGSLFLVCSLAMFLCWIISPYQAPDRSLDGKDIDQAKKELELKEKDELILPSRSFYVLFISLVICLNAIISTMEYQFNYFLSIYLTNYFKINGVENTNLLFLLGLAYIVGRGLVVLVSALKISVTKILYLNAILLLSGSVLIAFLILPSSDNLSTLLSVALILMGLGYSSCQPGMYVFVENRVNITSTLNSFMIATQTAFFCIESYRMSFKINSNPESFKNMNLVYTLAFTVVFMLLHLTDLIKNKFLTVKKII